jgi:antitoxin PrlF
LAREAAAGIRRSHKTLSRQEETFAEWAQNEYNSKEKDQIDKLADMENLTYLGKGGRITIPAKMRKALQIEAGEAVVLRLEGNAVQVIPLRQAVQLAQAMVKPYMPAGTSLVDELIASRQEEASRE